MPETSLNNVYCVVPTLDVVQHFPTQPPSGLIVVQHASRNRVHIVHSIEQCKRILRRLQWLPANQCGEMLEGIETISLFVSEEPPDAITISGAEAKLLSQAMSYYRFAIEGSEEHLPYLFERPSIISLCLPAKGRRDGAILGIHDRGPSVHIVYSRQDVRKFVEIYPQADGMDEQTRIHRLHECSLPETSNRQPLHITGYAARILLLGLVIRRVSHCPPIIVIALTGGNGAPEDDLPS